MAVAETADFSDATLLFHRQEKVLDSLKRGEISDVRVSQSYAADKIVSFGLREGFLQEGLKSFPDPRRMSSVPIDALILPQILQRYQDEHSLLLAPYMLNDADLITKLGYNARVLDEGFNDRAKYPRETPFHGETLKHVLNSINDSSVLLNWFNRDWLPLWRRASPGRTRQYILDGMKIEMPRPRKKVHEGSGVVSDNEGNVTYGYKAVWLQEIIDRKGVLAALTIVPIETNDLEAARSLVEQFPFEENSSLIMDRGFIDGAWITHLKNDLKVDVVVPLKKNMEATVFAISIADEKNMWVDHPTRAGQKMALITKEDLIWKECQVLESGTLVRWKNHEETEQVLFVSTLKDKAGQRLLEIYDQRAEIEDSHRELKCFQGIETLLSGKLSHVTFRIIINVISFNLLRLFLNSEACDSVEDFTAKTLRQKRRQEPNPQIIIYKDNTFATISFLDLISMLTKLSQRVLKKLSTLFGELKRQTTLNATQNRRQRPSRTRHPIAPNVALPGPYPPTNH